MARLLMDDLLKWSTKANVLIHFAALYEVAKVTASLKTAIFLSRTEKFYKRTSPLLVDYW